MPEDEEQPTLVGPMTRDMAELRAAVAAASDHWNEVRRHHAIGSSEEEAAWLAYWHLAEELWKRRGQE